MCLVTLFFLSSIGICCAIAYILGLLWFSDARNRRTLSFFLLGVEIFFWTLLNAVTMVINYEYFPLMYTLRMVFVCVIPFGLTWFILNFTGLSSRYKAIARVPLIILPAADILCVLTNPLHNQYFRDYIYPMPTRAPLFWAHLTMNFTVIIIAFIILIRFIIKNSKENPLLILTGIGLLIPYIINMSYTFGAVSFIHDVTPIGFFITFILFLYVAYDAQVFIIKTTLFSSTMNSVDDPIIISDERDVVVDINKSAMEIYPEFRIIPGRTKAGAFIGYMLKSVERTEPEDLFELLKHEPDVNGECALIAPAGGAGQARRIYNLHGRAIYEGKKKTGHILILKDVSNYHEMINEIKRRDDLLHAVNHAAAYLLNADTETYADNIYHAMKSIGEAVDADRVYIWRNHMVDGVLCCTQIHEWSEGAEPMQANEYTTNIPYDDVIPGLKELLSEGRCFGGIVSEMRPEYRAHLTAQGILSILIVPLFIDEEFWGFLGFDDCHNERCFPAEEEAILRSSGLLFAHAYQRNNIIRDIRETTTKLEEALELANAASKAKGDFLSNMSHEMRTPMNAIIGMTTIAKKEENIKEKNHALDKISDAASHLLGVINDVLDMAKIEANKLELKPVEYNLDRMLQRVMAVINFRIEEKKQIFTARVDKSVPRFVMGDDQRLAQVLTNLLSNAVKFTPEGGRINLDVSLIGEGGDEDANEDGDERALRVEVSDTGIGISTEQQARLFNAFEQAESGTSREYGGTGLGLVISKRVVELMGGRIWVESELGKGSRFFFTVKIKPLCSSSIADRVNECLDPGDAGAGAVGDKAKYSGKRLLVVEDIEINREILIALLEDTGLLIECAGNGQEAVDMVAREPRKYDIIFMDIQMPVMDGLQATRRIRSMPGHVRDETPIVAMTANVFKDDIDACIEAGMDDHLGKPLDIDKVMETLRKYLR